MFTIGKFAKIHKINKKTLMWYDEIGILKPAFIDKNGYRYYSYKQSSSLETILMLRELDVSIKEIKDFLENRSNEAYKNLIDKTLNDLKIKLLRLSQTEKILESKKEEAEILCNLRLDEITLFEKNSEKYLSAIPTYKTNSLENEVEDIIAEAKRQQIESLHKTAYGTMLPAERIYGGDLDGYSHLFIELPFGDSSKSNHIQPAGMYLRAFCKGSWDGISEKYRQILNYCNKNDLELTGFAYEKGINDFIVTSIEEYITQIEIPVKFK